MKIWFRRSLASALTLILGALLTACSPKGGGSATMREAAQEVYVPPGKHDDFYAFLSGGFNGQLDVYGLPSGRLVQLVPVFTVDPHNGYGYCEETQAMLMTSAGFVPWDDSHHTELSQTDGVPDGRWLFINANNTPRIARINLKTFETDEILEIPNECGNHASPFTTENTEYVVGATRFSIPVPQKDVPIASYAENFRGMLTFVKVDKDTGHMSVAFQILMPPFDYDLSHSGKGPSHGWTFFTCYNSEKAHTLLEVNASRNDKDFIAAVNWKKAEAYLADGRAKEMPATYYHNLVDEKTRVAGSEVIQSVKVLNPKDCPGMVYLLPCPKSPHGVDVDPTGEYIVAGGKLATVLPIFSFSKMLQAIDKMDFEREIEGMPVLRYEKVIYKEVPKPGLGPLHNEFDSKGNVYTSCFVSSEVIKTDIKRGEVVDRIPVYYSIGHLMIPGGDSRHPWDRYVLAMNKITKDRYLPTGPELCQSSQLINITEPKMRMVLDMPTIGEPHYAQGIPASLVEGKSKKIFDLAQNGNRSATKSEAEAKVIREGKHVHVYMTAIRSHFVPDNIEGVMVGDIVHFHVTNLEQDWDIPHGFTVYGSGATEVLVMPG
ncbi:MAG: Sec-dependent nitrous-oxide reductase, partial [Methylacidiphilaceae bacterium]|nr:Sec-dependent nitrous-oxide reductase [Candidatus Methylacidiphilaceae bacterium]